MVKYIKTTLNNLMLNSLLSDFFTLHHRNVRVAVMYISFYFISLRLRAKWILHPGEEASNPGPSGGCCPGDRCSSSSCPDAWGSPSESSGKFNKVKGWMNCNEDPRSSSYFVYTAYDMTKVEVKVAIMCDSTYCRQFSWISSTEKIIRTRLAAFCWLETL